MSFFLIKRGHKPHKCGPFQAPRIRGPPFLTAEKEQREKMCKNATKKSLIDQQNVNISYFLATVPQKDENTHGFGP